MKETPMHGFESPNDIMIEVNLDWEDAEKQKNAVLQPLKHDEPFSLSGFLHETKEFIANLKSNNNHSNRSAWFDL